jgi:hypothetical protein
MKPVRDALNEFPLSYFYYRRSYELLSLARLSGPFKFIDIAGGSGIWAAEVDSSFSLPEQLLETRAGSLRVPRLRGIHDGH